MKNTNIFNITIKDVSTQELLNELENGILFTPNIDHIISLQENKELFDAYQHATHIICDSKVLQLVSKFPRFNKITNVIQGSSFFKEFYKFHANKDTKIFFLGARDGVGIMAMENINKAIGRNIIVGAYSPSFKTKETNNEITEIINNVNRSGANVLVVGLGSPKQEIWISNNYKKFDNIKLFMALGATIDFEAGHIKRAPLFIQNIRLEWFYRLLKEPKRLAKRYLIKDIKIVYYTLLVILKKYNSPF